MLYLPKVIYKEVQFEDSCQRGASQELEHMAWRLGCYDDVKLNYYCLALFGCNV